MNSANECCEIIKVFFTKNIPHFYLIKEWAKAPFWHIEMRKENIEIEIDGDMGFHIYIHIYNSKYPLWQYDRSVNNKAISTEENILYQLNVLKRFLNEVGCN
ncbi:hypothetical protein FACS1894174_08620 [Bacteroidia bacterium]|nr:hypothetical protein FACS189455_4100 [Bacteroidia bacterium]GHV23135.1 hypothetical protein FACS1894174_08620 [Bacteroidia bacterium]